ncbi:carbohydrate ABC transporter permease [Paenibacillus doosanensis]|uniref:L-arabinose transport system permease protein AraQ n=1 Tax=Paenibacillus konkukensis TaxID=2020716 RepID=A0ABY4RI77_9BACL|nr:MULTISPECIES: carbohydrate ABC transporter permease [Paenibacillus]MCS7464129.1 carbohydrate ABC transporter permease [Paenibacillus doosanensis]UQZ81314.1 L-arabinose transport system permease protein AraQ [Paenibacillus konkukensis]
MHQLTTFRSTVKSLPGLLTHILLAAVAFVWIYPFLWMISASFKSQDEFFAKGLSLIPDSLNGANFARAWDAGHFDRYFMNSVIVTIAVIVIVLCITATCGYALGRYAFKGKRLIITVLAASMFVPLEFSIIPVFELIKHLGLMNSLGGIILAESGGGHLVFVLLFAGFFRQVPKELEEAAIMDGCGFFRTFVHIMLPLSKPIVGSAVIMQFIWTWNSFLLPLVLTLSNPDLRTLAVGLYALRGENIVDWTGIAAGGTIALVPIIIVFLLLQRYFVDGMAGAIKG